MFKFLWCAVLTSTSLGFANGNLLINGNFATGDFDGWTTSTKHLLYPSYSNLLVSRISGSEYGAQFGAQDPTDDILSQTIFTPQGGNYQISFTLANSGMSLNGNVVPADPKGYNKFVAKFEDTTLVSLEDENPFNATDYAFTVNVPSDQIDTTLQFSGRNPAYWWNAEDELLPAAVQGYYTLSDINVILLSNDVSLLTGALSLGLSRPQISLNGLKENNLIIANYFNKYASSKTIDIFSFQGSELKNALEKAAPTRNVFSTYSSQLTLLSLEKPVQDHLEQKRWKNRHLTASKATHTTAFVAQADPTTSNNTIHRPNPSFSSHESEKSSSLWLSVFGEYAEAKPKQQTPNFHTDSSGFVIAGDASCVCLKPIGAGVAYAHTHLHDEKGRGHANLNQGNIFIYGSFPIKNGYFDTTIWGGYYHSQNVRNISFTDFDGGSATAKIHGWQLTPHLEVGYDHQMNGLGLEPFAMADYVATWEHSANEAGSTPFNFGQKGRYCSLVRGEAGLRLHEMLGYVWGSITFMEKASYTYQKAFHTGMITAFLIDSSTDFFTVTALTHAQNMGVGELEVTITPRDEYMQVGLSVHAAIGVDYQAYQGIFKLGKNF